MIDYPTEEEVYKIIKDSERSGWVLYPEEGWLSLKSDLMLSLRFRPFDSQAFQLCVKYSTVHYGSKEYGEVWTVISIDKENPNLAAITLAKGRLGSDDLFKIELENIVVENAEELEF